MLAVDFFLDATAYIDKHAKDSPSKQQEIIQREVVTADTPKREYITPPTAPRTLFTAPVKSKDYKLDLENEVITLKGTLYPLPDCFNKKMLAQGDKKTLEMMFIYLGHPDIEA